MFLQDVCSRATSPDTLAHKAVCKQDTDECHSQHQRPCMRQHFCMPKFYHFVRLPARSLSGILLLVLLFCEASSKVCFSVCNLIPGCVHVDWEQDYLYVVFTTILVWVILIKPCNKNGHSLIQGLCSMESKRIGSSPRVHRMEVEHRIQVAQIGPRRYLHYNQYTPVGRR